MAEHVQIILNDDLDGTEATETVRFSLEGINYEIDLSTQNAIDLRSKLRFYVGSARRVPQNNRRKPVAASSPRNSDAAKIRAWALKSGYQVSRAGRIENSIRDAYYQANATG